MIQKMALILWRKGIWANRYRFALSLFAFAVLHSSRLDAREPLPPIPQAAQPCDSSVSAEQMRRLIEDDWLQALVGGVTTQSDAQGACDGVKNGAYGFHTAHQKDPWWQVDLGAVVPVARIVVYNRLDYKPGLHNSDKLQILSSCDGREWHLRHDNRGKHFGGITGAAPLEVTFASGELTTRFIRCRIPSQQPLFFHLDEVEVYGPVNKTRNLALGQPADQSSLSIWSTAKKGNQGVTYPIADCIQRARRLARDLRREGVAVTGILRELERVEKELETLTSNASDRAGGSSIQRDLYLRTRWIVRRLVLSNPLLDFDRLLFVKRFCQETYPDVCLNHMPWVSRPGGDLCILSKPFAPLGSGQQVRKILNNALGPGHVHGMDLWFDGDRIVFGYARTRSNKPPEGWLDRRTNFDLRRQEEPIHLYEIGIDGSNLRQLTQGEWSDLDPTYAPNGDIVFVSERCGTSLQCNEYDKDETSCNLYVMRPDGRGIRRLSVNKDGDYLPHTLNDGSIVYTRWEYHERSFAYIQSLWYIHPDGTGADALFKQHFANPWALEDARSIPNSPKLVAIAAGHHTLAMGPLVLIHHRKGLNEPSGIEIVTPGIRPPEGGMSGITVPEGGVVDHRGYYSTPWALSEKHFLVSYAYGKRPRGKLASEVDPNGYGLYVVDVYGNKELIYRDPTISCFVPIPLRARPRPPILPELVDLSVDYATCVISDITHGSEAIPADQAAYLRIAEPVGWPYDNRDGGHRYVEDHHTQKSCGEKKIPNESWTPIHILGDVPLAADGSVTFRVPADRAVYFQLLDRERMELRRMRSFISFQPGEQRACVGCHETRAAAPRALTRATYPAKRPEPTPLIPPPWGDRPISFLRDVQPVLDRHCVCCHSGLKPAGGFDFGGGLTAFDLAVPDYGYNRAYVTITTSGLVACSPARQQDASITMPFDYGARRSRLIEALKRDHHRKEVAMCAEDKLRLTMWIDGNAPYHDRFVNKRVTRTPYNLPGDDKLHQSLLAVHKQRCAACHQPEMVTRLDWIDIHKPEQSLFLSAPLSQAEGGRARCKGAVYTNRTDRDYQTVLGLVRAAVQETWARPRRDVQSLDSRSPMLAGKSRLK